MIVDFKWNKPIVQITKEATGGNRTLLFMATEAKRLMDPYVPALNMALSQNVRTYVEGERGVVHYLSPYARYQHEGILMVSRITGSPWAKKGESKVTTGRKLNHNKSRHPLATSEWEKAMKAARGREYEAAVQRFVNGG
ncbi:MAG: minor capsid protein [Lachnospiraceae bacterium]|nr:minor capsid protein [Lachnospiraceae bacterium]MDY2614249.1 minor capsid protein [Lachnospiraceae bacterium]MDY4207775.1 minor capsid protein [Lachnospiraceae bacterium]